MEKIEKNNLQSQKNIHKYNFGLIMLILTLFSCSNEIKETTYKYNSDEYHEKIKELKVPLDKAKDIASHFYFENNQNSKEFNFSLNFILGDFYVFCDSNCLYNLKTAQYFLKGIWVNGETGEAIYKDTDEYVKIIIDVPYSDLNTFSGTIKKPE